MQLIYKILQFLFPSIVFQKPNKNFCLYLTFDDGPSPEITDWVLKTLKKEQIHATFFCLGSQVELYPEIFEKIIINNHSIGNHGYEHLDGWKTSKKNYLENIEKGFEKTNSKLFRPPYGRINPFWISPILEKNQLIFWSVLTEDYNPKIKPEQKTLKILNTLKNGDILVFHDSEKAFKNLKIILPAVIEWGKKNNVKWMKL